MRLASLVVVVLSLVISQAFAIEVPLPGTLKAFNYCVQSNASPLVAQSDLLKVCLRAHARSLDSTQVKINASYRKLEGTTALIMEVANVSEDKLLTGLRLRLASGNQGDGQNIVLGPFGILPGTVSVIPITNLDSVPDDAELGTLNPSVQIVESYGLSVELQ